MNNLLSTLLALALQTTLLALSGLLVSTVLPRRRPGLRAITCVAGLSGCLVLAVVAWCPLPTAWEESPSVAPGEPMRATEGEPSAEPLSSESPPGWSLSAARRWWREVRSTPVAVAEAESHWPAWAAGLVLVCAGLGLLRLLSGWWGLLHYCRHSQPLDDAEMQSLADELARSLGCGHFELRVRPGLSGPATAGWWRPIVLLPPEWPTWSLAEKRAALAHELAHIRRCDYLAGLLGRFAQALHFYQPLVWWLVRRLRLEQELAADALAAPLMGGNALYLRALSQLALRQDDRPLSGLAPLFGTEPGTLLRRIAMLRARDGWIVTRSGFGQLALVALLTAATAGVATLRLPAQKPPATANTDVAPFDLSYLPADSKGAVAFRPAAIFGRPEMKELKEKANESLGELLQMLFPSAKVKNLKADLGLGVEDIEQVCGTMRLHTDKNAKEHPSSLTGSLTLIRTVKDYDWKKQLAALMPAMKEETYEGKSYYKIPEKTVLFMPVERCYYLPDARTLVFGGEQEVKGWIKPTARKTEPAWAADWKHVERGIVAVAYDLQDKAWMRDRPRAEGDENPLEAELVENCESLVLGFDYDKGSRFQGRARCTSNDAAKKAAGAIDGLVQQAKKQLPKPEYKGDEKARKVALDFLDHSRVERKGSSLEWRSTVAGSFLDVAMALLSEELGL